MISYPPPPHTHTQSKKTKPEVVVISSPSTTVELDQISTPIHTHPPVDSKRMLPSSTTADYEELPDSPPPRSMTVSATSKPFYPVARKAIENEYVPSPENSPRFDAHRQRSYTVGMWDSTDPSQIAGYAYDVNTASAATVTASSSQGSMPEVRYRQQRSLPQVGGQHQQQQQQQQTLLQSTMDEGNSSPGLKNRHLSGISMESGLSFGYDVEKDFNPSYPLESQPWYHGKISRADAESLLHDDGDFLVRENIKMPNTHTLSLRWRGRPDHTLISTTEVVSTSDVTRATGFKYHFDSGAFDTIPELVFNHLKYQIPIDKNQHTLITNPICRPGLGGNNTKGAAGGQAPGIYMSMLGASNYSSALSHVPPSPSGMDVPASTLPRNFGSSAKLAANTRRGTASPENRLNLGPRINFSPHHSPHSTPSGELKSYGSSGDLLETTSSAREDIEVQLRNVISPPPVGVRERSFTVSHTSSRRSSVSTSDHHVSMAVGSPSPEATPCHKKMDSFGDYEIMESVSILNGGSPLPSIHNAGSSRSSLDSQASSSSVTPVNMPGMTGAGSSNTRERVKYAEIRYPKKADGSRGGALFVQDSRSVKYAEIRFPNQGGSVPIPTSTVIPHPFSLYDTVPPPRKQNSPYQSRAELLAQKVNDYATPNPSAGKREKLVHSDSSPHPFSQSMTMPRTRSGTNYVQVSFGPPHEGTPSSSSQSQAPKPHGENVMYAILDKARRKKDRESTTSNDSALSTGSNHSGSPAPSSSRSSSNRNSPQVQQSSSSKHHHHHHHHQQHHQTQKALANVHSHIPEAKVHKSLPGYAMLVKIHTLLQSHSNKEIVYHLTRADATSFMLAPRPGEDARVWQER